MASASSAPADNANADDEEMSTTYAADESLSSFLAFTGTSDPDVAHRYLEMAGGDLETAVGLFVDHDGGGGGGGMGGGGGGMGGGGVGMMGGEVRAPDASRTMRLVGGYDDDLVRRPPTVNNRGGNNNDGDDGDDDDEPPAALVAALGGPAAREMMRNMRRAQAAPSSSSSSSSSSAMAMAMAGPNRPFGGMGMMDEDAMMGRMGGNWASSSSASVSGIGGGRGG